MEESTRATLADLLTYKHSPLLIKEATVQKPKEDTADLEGAFVLYLMVLTGSLMTHHQGELCFMMHKGS